MRPKRWPKPSASVWISSSGAWANILSASPDLEVKTELADALNAAGRREAALIHLEEAYRLDLADPLAVRSDLLACYLNMDRDDDAAKLLEKRRGRAVGSMAIWTTATGAAPGRARRAAEQQLQVAHRANPHVVSLLLNERMPDPTPPSSLETGEDSEAQAYAVTFLPAWRNTPGEISWLREAMLRLDLEITPPDDEPLITRRLTAQ